MLDDLAMFHMRDSRDLLGAAQKQWHQLTSESNLLPSLDQPIGNCVYLDPNGAALAAQVVQSWSRVTVPLQIVTNNQLPAYVGPATLLIINAHDKDVVAGVVSAAVDKQAIIVLVTNDIALWADLNAAYPGVLAARQAIAPTPTSSSMLVQFGCISGLAALCVVLQAVGLMDGQDNVIDSLSSCRQTFESALAGWGPTVATKHNQAKQLALEIAGKSALLYAGPLMTPVAISWKADINRYAKHLAWIAGSSSVVDDDLLGWSKQPIHKPYAVIHFQSNLESAHVQRQFDLSQRMLSGLRPSPIQVIAKGDSLLQQQLYCIGLGSFVALYLAMLAGNDPSSAEVLTKYNKRLKES